MKIRELRTKKNLTMKQLGDIVGVAESTISLYERGKRQPDFETLKHLADFFEVSIDYLLGAEGEKIKPAVPELPSDEQEFLKRFKRLNESDKEAILDQMQFLWEYKNRKKS